MKIGGIILATIMLLLLSVVASSQRYVFSESSFLTPISLNTESPSEYYPRGNASLPPPQVLFPTQEEIENYFLGMNVTAPTFISNSSMGNTTNIQQASSNGNSSMRNSTNVSNATTFVVFQTNLNGTDHVFLSMIGDPEITRGASYSNPVELTPALHGNISHLQIAADVDKAYVVWQDYNSTTDLSSIFVSSSMDSGKTFRTYRASENNTDAVDPSIAATGVIAWKEPCPETLPDQEQYCVLYYFRW